MACTGDIDAGCTCSDTTAYGPDLIRINKCNPANGTGSIDCVQVKIGEHVPWSAKLGSFSVDGSGNVTTTDTTALPTSAHWSANSVNEFVSGNEATQFTALSINSGDYLGICCEGGPGINIFAVQTTGAAGYWYISDTNCASMASFSNKSSDELAGAAVYLYGTGSGNVDLEVDVVDRTISHIIIG